MYSGGFKRVHDKKNVNFEQTRKLHISCLKNSKVITYAKTTLGKKHDCPFFEELVKNPIKNGFKIKTILADSGYMSKSNHFLCQELGITNEGSFFALKYAFEESNLVVLNYHSEDLDEEHIVNVVFRGGYSPWRS